MYEYNNMYCWFFSPQSGLGGNPNTDVIMSDRLKVDFIE